MRDIGESIKAGLILMAGALVGVSLLVGFLIGLLF